MNWDQVEGKWKELKGKIKHQWGKLTDDDLDMVAGERDQLIGRIQQRYGIAKEEAQEQVDRYLTDLRLEQDEEKARGAGGF